MLIFSIGRGSKLSSWSDKGWERKVLKYCLRWYSSWDAVYNLEIREIEQKGYWDFFAIEIPEQNVGWLDNIVIGFDCERFC